MPNTRRSHLDLDDDSGDRARNHRCGNQAAPASFPVRSNAEVGAPAWSDAAANEAGLVREPSEDTLSTPSELLEQLSFRVMAAGRQISHRLSGVVLEIGDAQEPLEALQEGDETVATLEGGGNAMRVQADACL